MSDPFNPLLEKILTVVGVIALLVLCVWGSWYSTDWANRCTARSGALVDGHCVVIIMEAPN